MAVIIGWIADQEQVLTLVDGRVHINDEPMPIRDVTQDEIDALAASFANAPEGDDEGREAYCNTRRINFLVSMLARTFGDECSEMLEHMIGNLHYRVLEYLGETDDLDEHVERELTRRSTGREPHHDHCGCHDHEHGHEHGCGHHRDE